MAKNAVSESVSHPIRWNGKGYSESSDVPVLSAPSGFTVTPSGTTNTLSWVNGNTSLPIAIYRGLTEGGTYSLITTVSAGSTSMSDSGLESRPYWYKVGYASDMFSSPLTAAVLGNIVSGSNGASISAGVLTLTGSGFPSKTRAAPLWWDNFVGAGDGTTLNGRVPIVDNASGASSWAGTYRGTGQRPYAVTSGTRVVGKPCAYHPLTSNNYNCSLDVYHPLPDARTPVYLSFWWKSSPEGNNRQVKPLAIYGNRPGTDNTFPEFYLGMGNYEAFPGTAYSSIDGSLRTSTQEGSGYSIPNMAEYGPISWGNVLNRFIKFELVLMQSGQNTADGLYALRVYDPDNPSGASTHLEFRQNFITRNVGGYVWRQFAFGHYAGGTGTGPMSCPVWTDDIIIDDSENHVRVVMGNSSDYTACTRVEDQPATSWSSTGISCTFNKGGFSTGQTGHVFVVTGAGHSGHGSSTYVGSVTIP